MSESLDDEVELSLPAIISANEQRLVQTLSDQHPIDGMIGEVFMALGGINFLQQWALDNPSKFIQLAMRQKPQAVAAPVKPSEIIVRIESSLGRTALDENNIRDVN